MYKKIVLPIFLVFVFAQNVCAADIRITRKEAGFYFTPEYNRSLDFCWALSTIGAIQLNDRYTTKGGLALGSTGEIFDIKAFTGFEVALPIKIPLSISVAYNYNGLPEYEVHTHSILPLISLKWKWAGFSLGTNFRFTDFFGETTVFEPVQAVLVYVNVINNDSLQIGLKLANFDDFTYGNHGSYFLNIYSAVYLNAKLSLINEIEAHQSGSIALASNFYGIVYRGGVKFLW